MFPAIPHFHPVTDPFCQALHAYISEPTFTNRRQNLYQVIGAITPMGVFSRSPTGQNRLMYMITKLAENKLLKSSLSFVEHFLTRVETIERQSPKGSPKTSIFLMLTPDQSGMTLLKWIVEFDKLELTITFGNILHPLIERGNSYQEPLPRFVVEQILGTHETLLRKEHGANVYLRHFAPTFEALKKKIILNMVIQHLPTQQSTLYQLYVSCNILDRLLKPGLDPEIFSQHLKTLKWSVLNGWLTGEMYASILTKPTITGRTILHNLVYRDPMLAHPTKDLNNFLDYLHELSYIRSTGLITQKAYVALFTKENFQGYSVVHQAINSPNEGITLLFMDWFDHDPYLSPRDRSFLINYQSDTCLNSSKGAYRKPRRIHDTEQSSKIRDWLSSWRKNLPRSPQCGKHHQSFSIPLAPSRRLNLEDLPQSSPLLKLDDDTVNPKQSRLPSWVSPDRKALTASLLENSGRISQQATHPLWSSPKNSGDSESNEVHEKTYDHKF